MTDREPVLGLRGTGPARTVTAELPQAPWEGAQTGASERASSEQGGGHPPAPDRKTRSRYGPELRGDRVVPTLVTVFREGLACSRPETAPSCWSGETCAGDHFGDLARGLPSELAQVWKLGSLSPSLSPSVPPLQSTEGASPGTGSSEWAARVVGVEGGCVAPVLYGLGLGRSLR